MTLRWINQSQWQSAFRAKRSRQQLLGAALALGLAIGIQPHATAAEKLVLKWGPFQQTVHVADIDRYAQTGEVPNSLLLLKPFLNDTIRKSLNMRLKVEPSLAQQFATDILTSPSGQALLTTLGPAFPGLSPELIQTGVSLAIRQFHGLDTISVLKAIPQDTIAVDLSKAIDIVAKLNWNYWRTQAMTTVLQDSLKVEAAAVKLDFDPAAVGSYKVNKTSMVRRHSRRQREITFDIYSPQVTAIEQLTTIEQPLVMIAPGYEADKRFLAYLAEHLASHGFTVVALQHPSVAKSQGKISLDRLIPATEFVDRPRDVSFLLDELAKLNQDSQWQGQFNTKQTVVIGHSLGGYTALALAGGEIQLDQLREFCQKSNVLERVPADWLQCNAIHLPNQRTAKLRDPRVVQVMALNPAIGKIFGSTGLSKVATPTLILSSSEDALAPALSQQLQPFAQLSDKHDKYLFTAIGATHLSISDPDNFSGPLAEGTLVKEKRGPEMARIRQTMRSVTLAFISQLTPEAARFKPVLTPAYIQSQSSPPVVFRFNRQLPTNLTNLFQLTAMLQAPQTAD